MQVEQLPPNKPKFLLILILFCVAILVIFLAAWLFLRTNSGHLGMRHTTKEPHSQLMLPPVPRAISAPTPRLG